MSQIKCSICKAMLDSKLCIKTKTQAGVEAICCKDCKPEYAAEIQSLQNNPKLILVNVPVKKI
ncbi:hypothetical protein UFOVP53_66 [uncultured Caudovirales phage]|uniref:Uncharacterized protein n=1 Tax=uncultured Caudovirales phage TaxID=2100421 RepID=A0A6J5KRM7_9CAUD|nr:hypothetical protein UFOVP53_66 [uncultured Caudovirales phage]